MLNPRDLWRTWLCAVALALALVAPGSALAQDGPPPAEVAAPPATKAEVTKPAPSPVAAPAPEDSGGYELRVKELEEKTNDLKEKIFRSKSRLVLLKETVLRGKIAGSKAILVHKNEMGSSFKLEHAIYSLDGNQMYNKRDQDGDLADKERLELFNGAIVPGKHNVSVLLVFRGNGYGVFSYLQGYKFQVVSSYAFNAEEGKTTKVSVVPYEKGNFTTALEDRPDVRYETEFFDANEGEGATTGK